MFKRNNEVVYGNEEVRPFVLNRYRKLRTNGFTEEEIANCIVLNSAERKVLEKEFGVFDKTKSDILNALDTFDINEVPVKVDEKPTDKEEEVNVYVPDKKKSPFDEAMAKLEQLEKVVCKYIKTTEPEAKETKKETKPEAKQTKPEAKETKKEDSKPQVKPVEETKKEDSKPEVKPVEETKKEDSKPEVKPNVVSNFNANDIIKKQLEKAKETKPEVKPNVVSNFNASDIIKKQLEKAKKETDKPVEETKKENSKPKAKQAKKETAKPEAKETKKETAKPEAKETKKEDSKPEYKNENIDGVDYVYLPLSNDEMYNLVEDIKENYEHQYNVTLNRDKLEKYIVNILADTHILDESNTYLELFNSTLAKMDELIDSNTVEIGNAAEEDELLKNLNSIFEA